MKKIDIGYKVYATQMNNEATTALGFPGDWMANISGNLANYN